MRPAWIKANETISQKNKLNKGLNAYNSSYSGAVSRRVLVQGKSTRSYQKSKLKQKELEVMLKW